VRRGLLAIVLAAAVISVAASFAAARPARPSADEQTTGRQLYRKFCGQCHALAEANAAGFGSNNKGGYGDLGGPSFNDLRVPYQFNITAVIDPSGGHTLVRRKITTTQLHIVARYIAKVTRNNPIPARPTSG
jgi:mono/diheme cytochrome c family protein